MGDAQDTRVQIAWVEQRTGNHRTTISRWCAAEPPTFPRPHYLGTRRVWWMSEILAWEAAKMAQPRPARSLLPKAVGT